MRRVGKSITMADEAFAKKRPLDSVFSLVVRMMKAMSSTWTKS